MKNFILVAIFVFVSGYIKSNGTYVAPYVRTSPDSTICNNYSYEPKVIETPKIETFEFKSEYKTVEPKKWYELID